MAETGKLLMVVGFVLVLAGAGLWFASRMGLPLGRLPGDVAYRGKNVRVYFPLGTSIVISIVLSLIFYILSHLRR